MAGVRLTVCAHPSSLAHNLGMLCLLTTELPGFLREHLEWSQFPQLHCGALSFSSLKLSLQIGLEEEGHWSEERLCGCERERRTWGHVAPPP